MPLDALEGAGDLIDAVCEACGSVDAVDIDLGGADIPADIDTSLQDADAASAAPDKSATRGRRRSLNANTIVDVLDALYTGQEETKNAEQQPDKRNDL